MGLSLHRRKVISAPQLDLTDFDVGASRIWALWSNAEGDFSISSFSLKRGMGMNWISAAMEPPPDRYCLGVEHGMDPREAYCSYIFHPGKFERSVIAKALFVGFVFGFCFCFLFSDLYTFSLLDVSQIECLFQRQTLYNGFVKRTCVPSNRGRTTN